MARRIVIATMDALNGAERRRVEALRLAITMNPDWGKDPDPFFKLAEQIEDWIKDANGVPMDDIASWARGLEERRGEGESEEGESEEGESVLMDH